MNSRASEHRPELLAEVPRINLCKNASLKSFLCALEFLTVGRPDTKTLHSILAFPKDLHPMTQFSMGILACQKESHFAQRYQEGMKKSEYWDPTYEDMLTCIARLPRIAGEIRRTFLATLLPCLFPKANTVQVLCSRNVLAI